MMKKLIIAMAFMLPTVTMASPAVQLDRAPIDTTDEISLQRGARTFVNYCLNCHSATHMRYNRLQDIGLTDEQIKANLLFSADKVGDAMTISMAKDDAKAWFGTTPPDLTLVARARGADWLYTYMRGFYRDDTRLTGWNNVVYDKVAMPHVLWNLQGEQVVKAMRQSETNGLKTATHGLILNKPGLLTSEEYDAMVADLVNYMVYMAEPAQNERKRLGVIVLLYLSLLFAVTYLLKKEFWKDIH
jgi:ubiquinol-cytochrome c reductase cytochrome c1 subunit